MNISSYLKEVRAELRNVKWPTLSTTLTYTLLVIGISVAVALFLSAVDLGLHKTLHGVLTHFTH